MDWQVDWRRVATGAAVLVLHLLLILALLTTTGVVPLRIGSAKEIMLILTSPQHRQEPQSTPEPKIPEHVPLPMTTYPAFQPQAITALPPLPKKPTAAEGDIGALGRYLFNCSAENFEGLSQRDKAHCLANKWDNKKSEKPPLLGEAKPSQFDDVLIKRDAPFVPAFHGCDPSSLNASLHNVPCMDTQDSSHNILEEVPDH
jgi:hypothetical protein